MVKVIRVRAIEKTTRDQKKKFVIFKARKIDGTFVPLKFTKEVEGLPKTGGLYDFTIDTAMMNKSHDDYGEVYWAKGFEDWCTAQVEDTAAEEF